MNKSKKITLFVLLGVLTAVCAVIIIVTNLEEKKEKIKSEEAIVLKIDGDNVTALSWEYGETSLSFTKDDQWLWDEDAAFPVNSAKIDDLLAVFSEFSAAFTIEDVEDYAQYGLDEPEAVIRVTEDGSEREIKLGTFSTLDEERYVSIGDGKVYLAVSDPMEDFELTIEDMILNDDIPDLTDAAEIAVDGTESYTITYEEDSGKSCCKDDVYFAGDMPLDTTKIASYLSILDGLSTATYETYNATGEELAAFGLDEPGTTVTVTYPVKTENAEESEETEYETFTLTVGQNREELEKAEESDEEDEESEVTAYFRIGDSPIVYRLLEYTYEELTANTVNDLRHEEIVTASFDDAESIDIVLEDETYTITARTEDTDEDGEDERIWSMDGRGDIEIAGIQTAIESLSAYEFTEKEPKKQEEIRFTLHLNDENFPEIEVVLYRYDGDYCLAVTDGEPVALVLRSEVVDLIEAVNSIILD